MIWALGAAGFLVGAFAAYRFLFVPWATRWGSSADERRAPMPGDDWVRAEPHRMRLVTTRAVSIDRPVEDVWPWVAQMGRGAGWYSYDLVDNDRRGSASHLVSWVPEPRLGDATAIGYLRYLVPGRCLAWWAPGERWLGSDVRMAASYLVGAEGSGVRLVQRVTADGVGWSRFFVKHLFVIVDTLMSRRQLLGIRDRAQRFGARHDDPARPETGARDQFQLYACVYADGQRCGVPDREAGERWHEVAASELGSRMGAAHS
jgi:hypothetical protein